MVTRLNSVTDVSTKENVKNRPEGINTVQLLKHSSAVLGLGPNDAMNIAEKLYLEGYITYPRTETTLYSQNFDFRSILISFTKVNSHLGIYANQLLQFGFSEPKAGVDAGDHPPITPTTKVPQRGSLSGNEGKMYDYICKHFLATISRDARYAKTKVSFEAGGHSFNINGIMILDTGFLDIAQWIKLANKTIPNFTKGQVYPISSAEVKESQTSPPNYLSESELISLMEKHGIGTDASMATHINNICQRNFVEIITRARRLKPTPLGNALIMGYKKIDPELISAELRGNIERNVEQIARGEVDIDTVLSSVIGIFKQKYEYFRMNISKIELEFIEVYGTFNDSLKKGQPFSNCGRCGNKMMLVEDFNKIYCKNCKITLNLPRDSKYSLEGSDVCPLDGYQIINYYIRNLSLTLVREGLETHLKCCPQCYHKSPHPEISQRLICSQCPSDTCTVSALYTEVAMCPRCSRGKLILNRSIDRAFYATCNNNRCTHCLILVHNAADVKRSQQKCPHCTSYKLKVVHLLIRYRSEFLWTSRKPACFATSDTAITYPNPISERNLSLSTPTELPRARIRTEEVEDQDQVATTTTLALQQLLHRAITSEEER